jgi:hypothetical protein
MKNLLVVATVAVATLTTGCANLTPEQNAALGAGLMGAAAVGAAVADSRRPVYVQPAPVVVVRPVLVRPIRCDAWGRCW